jgi:hypothetical protein
VLSIGADANGYQNSINIGNDTSVSAQDSVVVGLESSTDAPNAILLGNKIENHGKNVFIVMSSYSNGQTYVNNEDDLININNQLLIRTGASASNKPTEFRFPSIILGTSSNNIQISQSNVAISSCNFSISAPIINLISSNNASIGTSNNYIQFTHSNTTQVATSLFITAGSNYNVNSSNIGFTTSSNFSVISSNNYITSSHISIDSSESANISSSNLQVLSSNISIDSSGGTSISSSNVQILASNISLTSGSSLFTLEANQFNVSNEHGYLEIDSNSLHLYHTDDILFDQRVTCTSNLTVQGNTLFNDNVILKNGISIEGGVCEYTSNTQSYYNGAVHFSHSVYFDSNCAIYGLPSNYDHLVVNNLEVGNFSNLITPYLSNVIITDELFLSNLYKNSNYLIDLIHSNSQVYGTPVYGSNTISWSNGHTDCPAHLDEIERNTVFGSMIIENHLHVGGVICASNLRVCNIDIAGSLNIPAPISTNDLTSSNVQIDKVTYGLDSNAWWTTYQDYGDSYVNLVFKSKLGTIVSFDDEFVPETLNFTGKHRCKSTKNKINLSTYVGCIVIATGSYMNLKNTNEICIDEAIPVIDLCKSAKDKRVFGVIGGVDTEGLFKLGYLRFHHEHAMERVIVQNVGEGAIWVCNYNGNIDNGDYITASPIPGLGMKQDNDIIHNYTVAKITCDCSFEKNSKIYSIKTITYQGVKYIKALVGCMYCC